MIDDIIINRIRENSRFSLAKLARKLKSPVTTLYYRLDMLGKKFFKKHVSLLDFEAMHYKRIFFFIEHSDMVVLENFDERFINNAYRHYNGLILECIFFKEGEQIKFREDLNNLGVDFYESPIEEVIKQEEFKIKRENFQKN